MTLPIPTEEVEQRIFVEWLRLKGLPHWRTPNETYTKSWSQKAKNRALGVVAGIPDLFIVIPNKRVIGIEMKRTKGSTTSLAQKRWQQILNDAGLPTFICYGANEAINLVESYLPKSRARHSDTMF